MGIVKIEMKLTRATVFEASPVSLPYFAENIMVLFALGDDAVMAQAVKSVPVTPQSL